MNSLNRAQNVGHALGILLILLIGFLSVGCAPVRSFKQHSSRFQQCQQCPPPVQYNSLPLIEDESRLPFQIREINETIDARPVADSDDNEPIELKRRQRLELAECQSLAYRTSPVAEAIETHRNWLCTLRRTPHAVIKALTAQAEYERSQHAFAAAEAYLNLARVYSKPPLISQSETLVSDGKQVVERFRDAGVEIPGDTAELDRRQLEILEQQSELRFNQKRLNDAIEMLLNLAPSPHLVWTDHNLIDVSTLSVPDEESAVREALSKRGDLQALEILAENAQYLSLEALQGSPVGGQILSGGFSLPGPAKWWQCLLRREIDCLKQKAQSERQRKLYSLAENKRNEIRQEVRTTLHSLTRHQELLSLKLVRLKSLRQSLASAVAAKDVRPVDFRQRLEQQAGEIELISEIIDQLLSIETEYLRLQHQTGQSYLSQTTD